MVTFKSLVNNLKVINRTGEPRFINCKCGIRTLTKVKPKERLLQCECGRLVEFK